MASSRPARSAYIVLAVSLGLLPLLAIYQYRWIGEISQAQRRDAEDHLNQAGFQMSQDLDRELSRVLTLLEIRGRSDREDLSDWFAQRYDDATAAYPGLVLLDCAEKLIRFDAASIRRRVSSVKSNRMDRRSGTCSRNIDQRLDRARSRQRGP